LLTSVDKKAITSEKADELLAALPERSWAACAAIWSRVFVLAGPGWKKAPKTTGAMREAFFLAMQRAAGIGAFVPDELCVPKTSSTLCNQAVFVDQATNSSLFLDAVVVEIDRFG
jgi:hypothetical protein